MVFIWWNHLPVLPLILHPFTPLFVTFSPPLFYRPLFLCCLSYFLSNTTSAALISGVLVHLSWNCHFTCTSKILIYMRRSGITLWPLTGEVNNTDYLFIVAPVIGWDILGSKWTRCPQSWCVRSRKNGQAWGFMWVWRGTNCDGSRQYLSKVVQGRRSGELAIGSRLIDARGERRSAHVVWSNRQGTVAQIAEEVNAGPDRKVSGYKVHRNLLHMELHSHRPVRVPMLTPVHHRSKCQQWAREHQNWTAEQWKKG